MAPSLIDRYRLESKMSVLSRWFIHLFVWFCRRGEVTEEYIVDMQSADINRFGEQSIVLQPLSNNTHIQKTKYYENEVSTKFTQPNLPWQ